MLTFFIVIGSIGLLLLCAWLILLILMQKPSANAGMGAALGGGAAESAFGGEASNVLTRWTVYGVIGFFVLTLTLSLAQIYRHHHDENKKELAPMAEEVIEAPKSLTELPTNTGKAKADTKKEAANHKTSKEGTSKTDVDKSKASKVKASKSKDPKVGTQKAGTPKSVVGKGTAKKAATSSEGSVAKGADTAKVDASKKASKSKISYRSDAKKSIKRKSASSGKSDTKKSADTKKTVAR